MTSLPDDARASRDEQTREAESREMAWTPPNALPDPHPRPGIVHRWVRTASMGQPDPVNVSQSFREGWTPVLGAEYPELRILSDHGTRWPDGIEVGGLLLCSAPADHILRIREHYRKMARNQMKSVNDQLEAEEDPRLRTMFREHLSLVTRGFGPPARHERSGPAPKSES
jgi:hypothetical protein